MQNSTADFPVTSSRVTRTIQALVAAAAAISSSSTTTTTIVDKTSISLSRTKSSRKLKVRKAASGKRQRQVTKKRYTTVLKKKRAPLTPYELINNFQAQERLSNNDSSATVAINNKINISFATAETRGGRAYMEDRHSITAIPNTGNCLLSVFDGHNGSLAAEYAADNLHAELSSGSTSDGDLSSEKFSQTFSKIESEIIDMTLKKKTRDGSTALVAAFWNNKLWIAHLGDSRAVLSKRNCRTSEALTLDHKPDEPTEAERVEAAGGTVIHSGVWRVSHPAIPIRLAVSRAFGDHPLKWNLPPSCVAPLVSSTPTVSMTVVTSDLEFLVLASDGIWDRLSDQDAIDIVREEFKENCTITEKCQSSANRIIEVALGRRSLDNITVIVVAFH